MRISDWSSDLCSSDLNDLLTRRMRAHSNFVENTAFVLILLALVELGFGSSIWLWGVGALYLVGRILHALGMDGMLWGRMVGTIVTMLTQLGLAPGAPAIVYLTPVSIRSEEPKSELPTLIRTSYAVSCLKK